jgi:predicted lipoprotein with Yx(FWY)xxD motif
MKTSLKIAAVIVMTTAFGALAQAATPAKTAQTAKGPALVNAQGMTLYTFAKDSAGKSACNGPCAVNWPILAAGTDAKASGDWTVVTRDDGSKMWAYKGKPLYTFKNDMAAGDVKGDGLLNGAWQIAKP